MPPRKQFEVLLASIPSWRPSTFLRTSTGTRLPCICSRPASTSPSLRSGSGTTTAPHYLGGRPRDEGERIDGIESTRHRVDRLPADRSHPAALQAL
jgi:hypothetical protein